MRAPLLLLFITCSGIAAAENLEGGKAAALRVIEAIYSGSPVEDVQGAPTLKDKEFAELAGLAGCEPNNEQHQKALIPIFDWVCSNNPENNRTTSFYISYQAVDDILVQPVASEFRPTEASLAVDDLPIRKKLSRQFIRAVRQGDDPTLGGLIPLSEIQLDRLRIAEGTRATKMSGGTRNSHVYIWHETQSTQGKPLITDLRFDDEGRPIGLVISHGMIVRR